VTFPKSFHVLRSDDYTSQTRRYAFQNSYRQVEGRMYDWSDTGRLIVDSIYVVGYAPNVILYWTHRPARAGGTTFLSSRPSAADSVRGADLTTLHTPLPQATLETYVETIRSMPTPYGLVSTSQNLVEHQLTLTQPNQVIWYSLEPKKVNYFMSFVRSQICGATRRRSECKSGIISTIVIIYMRLVRYQSWATHRLPAEISTSKKFFGLSVSSIWRSRKRMLQRRSLKHHGKLFSRHDKHVSD
jgi:hypothetical protein